MYGIQARFSCSAPSSRRSGSRRATTRPEPRSGEKATWPSAAMVMSQGWEPDCALRSAITWP